MVGPTLAPRHRAVTPHTFAVGGDRRDLAASRPSGGRRGPATAAAGVEVDTPRLVGDASTRRRKDRAVPSRPAAAGSNEGSGEARPSYAGAYGSPCRLARARATEGGSRVGRRFPVPRRLDRRRRGLRPEDP